MSVLVAGYTYIHSSYFNTFRNYPGDIFFLLPKIWKAKGGRVVYTPPVGDNVITATTVFSHSHYPIIGGLLKGWMPAFPLVLWRGKKRKKKGLVFSCGEPTLLSTLYNAFWSKMFGLKHIPFSWENIPYTIKFKGISGLLHYLILRACLALSDGIICGNSKGRDIFMTITKKPIAVIPLIGVDEEFFKPFNTEKKFMGKDFLGKTVFTFVGALGYRKGIHLAISVFQKVVDSVPNAVLVVAGTGEYEQELENLIKEKSLQDVVFRFPWLDHGQLKELLAVSDIFLYPSFSFGGWEEQFGYSMAEASLMELPVISTCSGSISDVIVDGQTGILVKPESSEELAKAMITLGQDRELCVRLGKAGRLYIGERFNSNRVATMFYNFFKQI